MTTVEDQGLPRTVISTLAQDATELVSSSSSNRFSQCSISHVRLILNVFQIFPGMFAQSQVTCNECSGRGKVIKKVCPHCQGNKVIDHTAHYTLDITPGMPEGHEVVFEGEADESPDWEAGDVVLRVRSKREKGAWRRKETSLYWKQTIGIDEVRHSFHERSIGISDFYLFQALLGFERNITHLDGRNLEIVRKGVTQPGSRDLLDGFSNHIKYLTPSTGFVQVIKGEGMPVFGNRNANGDLFIEYNVVLPAEVSPEMRRSESFFSCLFYFNTSSVTRMTSSNFYPVCRSAYLTLSFYQNSPRLLTYRPQRTTNCDTLLYIPWYINRTIFYHNTIISWVEPQESETQGGHSPPDKKP